MIDIPTAVTEPEAAALAQLAAGKFVLEVGSLLGYSTVTMALVAEHVTSIDPHHGYPEDDPRPTWEPFIQNLRAYGVDDRVTPYREDDRVLQFESGHPVTFKTYDFAFIDADGNYDTTYRILDRVHDVMHVDAKIIAVHDYGLMTWPGAGEAVRDWTDERGFRFGVIDTLALIRLRHPDD